MKEQIVVKELALPSCPTRVVTLPKDREAARQQRRLEVERELRLKLQVDEEATLSPDPAAVEDSRRRLLPSCLRSKQGSRSAGPPRPPKPKPHRPVTLALDEAKPAAHRWKSALLPLWPDRSCLVTELEAPPEASNEAECPELLSRRATERSEALEQSFQEAAEDKDLQRRELGVLRDSPGVPCLLSKPHQEVQLEQVRPLLPPCANQESSAELSRRRKQLEESSRRLLERAARSRLQSVPGQGKLLQHAAVPGIPLHAAEERSPSASPPSVSSVDMIRMEEIRRKIAELDKLQEQERARIDEEQREAEARREAQEAFERSLKEQTERHLLQLRAAEAFEASEQARREEELRKELEERTRKRQAQMDQEQHRSKLLEETRREGRTEAAQLRWQQLEEELERQWAQQENEEKRRVDEYARERLRQYEDWGRKLAAERQRYASEAEFCASAREARRAMQNAERQFRQNPEKGTSPPLTPPVSKPTSGVVDLWPEEHAVLQELQAARFVHRDAQKAKVKELLFRWHPDKNPDCVEKATRVFQFVQRQRELVLGL